MRALIFLSIIGLINYYVSARLFAYAPLPKVHFLIPLLVALLLFGIELLDLRTTFLQSYPALKLVLSLTTGTILCLLFYFFVADVVLLATRPFYDLFPYDKTVNILFYSVAAITVVTIGIGAVQARLGPRVKHVSVAIKNLPPAFEGYKIVQVSDLHIGGTIRKSYVENVVRLVNATDADLIALTGDFADGTVEDLKEDSGLLKDLKSKDGIYFITGNHEYYQDVGNWLPFYQKLGFHVLQNRHEVITRNDGKLVIAGVNDLSTRSLPPPERIDVAAAAKGMPADAVKILLMHQPSLYKDAEAAGFDLQLSGHTHGGQFFPWTLVVPFFHHFSKGLGAYKNLQVYVNVGTGYWGPALRTFMPSEITVLTLTQLSAQK